jgi:hypothetical protein
MSQARLSDKFETYLGHWRGLRQQDRVPTLATFLDNPIPIFQPWIAIFDIADDLPVRLHGTALVDFFGKDFTGIPANQVFTLEGFAAQHRIHTRIANTLNGCFLISSGVTSSGRPAELHSLGLPLSRRNGDFSAAWLVEPAVALGYGEAGMPVTGVVAEQWIDLV